MVTCTFAWACSKRWADLAASSSAQIGYCPDCRQQVIQVRSASELAVALALRRCVAILKADEAARPEAPGLGDRADPPATDVPDTTPLRVQPREGAEWELGLPLPPLTEEEWSRPTPVYVRLPGTLSASRRDELRLALLAVFDNGRAESILADGATFQLAVLPRAHAEPLMAELKRVAGELLVFSDR